MLQPSVFSLNTWRYCDVEVGLSAAAQLEDIMYLVTQSFEKNMDNGSH
jgi:predicted transport protein